MDGLPLHRHPLRALLQVLFFGGISVKEVYMGPKWTMHKEYDTATSGGRNVQLYQIFAKPLRLGDYSV